MLRKLVPQVLRQLHEHTQNCSQAAAMLVLRGKRERQNVKSRPISKLIVGNTSGCKCPDHPLAWRLPERRPHFTHATFHPAR